ncbi:hypothetical protein RJ641_016256 [Dillenia turbinata]|uniref:Uncharacterized protein n=1 Tax=Dillenia turbinata TaxID=194707 RepID=A0AAN8V3M8_9MAGN
MPNTSVSVVAVAVVTCVSSIKNYIFIMEAGNRSGGRSRMPSMNGRSRSNEQVPQLFNPVPSLDEAVSYLAETTSYIKRCLSDSAGIAYGSARATMDGQEMVTFASEQTEANDHDSSNGNYSALSRLLSTVTAAPSAHVGISRSSTGESSQNAGASAEPFRTVQNGISLFQGYENYKVAGLALAQSPYGGSPIASDILREGQLGDYVNVRKMMEYLFCKVVKGDLQALEDLTYERRKEFLRKYPLPRELPVVSFHTEASISPAVLSTLSHVAHAELPTPLLPGELTKVPVVMPLGAAMAACVQLLQIRYGEKSDGLVTCRDAEVPGSVVVRPKQKLDHAWMVYSLLKDDPSEASPPQVCEALLTLLVEVGQKKRHELTKKVE